MQEMVLEQIGRTRPPEPVAATTPSKIKHAPKVPAQRYAERNPSPPPLPVPDADMAMDTDIDDYVYDVFVREAVGQTSVAASSVSKSAPSELENFGLLVITEDNVAQWESYVMEEEESERDWNTDEDDENGECHLPGFKKEQGGICLVGRCANGVLQLRITMRMIIRMMRGVRMGMVTGWKGKERVAVRRAMH